MGTLKIGWSSADILFLKWPVIPRQLKVGDGLVSKPVWGLSSIENKKQE